ASVNIGNINGRTLNIYSTYNVSTPTVSALTLQGTPSFDATPPTRAGLYTAPGYTLASGVGIVFTGAVSVPSGFAQGQWNFLQLWRGQARWVVGGSSSDAGWWNVPRALWGTDNYDTYPALFSTDPYTGGLIYYGTWA